MPDFSRRLFLFGSSAAVAAAALPVAVDEIVHAAFVTPVPALQNFRRREVNDLLVSFNSDEEGYAHFKLFGNTDERPLFDHVINLRSWFRWAAMPGHEIAIGSRDTFRIELNSRAGLGSVQMICRDWIDDDYPIEVSEVHEFPSRGPAIITPLYPDNSPLARRERWQARQAALI